MNAPKLSPDGSVREETCVSVMCERPDATREPLPPDTVTLLWIGTGVVAVIALLAGLHQARNRNH